jgi:hypothetical protein
MVRGGGTSTERESMCVALLDGCDGYSFQQRTIQRASTKSLSPTRARRGGYGGPRADRRRGRLCRDTAGRWWR